MPAYGMVSLTGKITGTPAMAFSGLPQSQITGCADTACQAYMEFPPAGSDVRRCCQRYFGMRCARWSE